MVVGLSCLPRHDIIVPSPYHNAISSKMPSHRNHVVLLRHCVRSTRSTIKVCNGDDNDDANSNSTTTKRRIANLTEYIKKTPLPEWGVPPLWCTERGMDIIGDLGRYLINNVVINNINAASSNNMQHVDVKIISDTSQRDVDTSLALLRSMKESLTTKSLLFSGLDQIHINHEVFSYTTTSENNSTCPTIDSSDQERSEHISNRVSRLPPSDFHVQDVLDLIIRLGGLDESTLDDGSRCPGGMGLSLDLLKSIAEMAFYSRASHVNPPFLPSASDEDVYRIINVADYVKNLERLDNKGAAKRGLFLAKSMLKALFRVDSHEATRSEFLDDNREVITVTIFVGHDSNINHIATVLGLRWTIPPPYVYGSDDQVGKIVSIPPGSGIIFSSFPETDADLSMSFVVPVNLIGSSTTNTTTNHQLIPIYTIDMVQPEMGIRDDVSGNAAISTKELKYRLETTMTRYPDLRACYEDAPTFLGRDDFQERTTLSMTPILLAAIVVVNLIGCVVFVFTQHRRSNKRYEQVRLKLGKRPEVELC